MEDRGGDVDFDEVEYGRWRDTARAHLDDSHLLAGAERAPAAVLHAEQAAQCALKALLHGAGVGGEARGHDLVALVERCDLHTGLVLADELRTRLADLSSDYQPVRYPDALPGGTPASHYGRAQADRAVETAAALLADVEARWTALHETAGEEDS